MANEISDFQQEADAWIKRMFFKLAPNCKSANWDGRFGKTVRTQLSTEQGINDSGLLFVRDPALLDCIIAKLRQNNAMLHKTALQHRNNIELQLPSPLPARSAEPRSQTKEPIKTQRASNEPEPTYVYVKNDDDDDEPQKEAVRPISIKELANMAPSDLAAFSVDELEDVQSRLKKQAAKASKQLAQIRRRQAIFKSLTEFVQEELDGRA